MGRGYGGEFDGSGGDLMAEKCYIVAYDIQNAGAGNAYYKNGIEAVTGYTEAKAGNGEHEGKGAVTGANAAKSGLYAHQGCNVVQCKMVELTAKSFADAVAIVREQFAQNAGGERAVEKPNETNFQVIL